MKIKHLSEKELIDKILRGERDFNLTRLDHFNPNEEIFALLYNYLKAQPFDQDKDHLLLHNAEWSDVNFTQRVYDPAIQTDIELGLSLPYIHAHRATFNQSCFRYTNLNGADFWEATFNECDLTKAQRDYARFNDAVLNEVAGVSDLYGRRSIDRTRSVSKREHQSP